MAETKQYGLSGINAITELGKGGVKLKSNSGILEAKNSANNAFVIVRALDAVGNNDVVTKGQMDIAIGGVTAGAPSRAAELAFDTSSPLNIGAVVAAGVKLLRGTVSVSTPFNGTAPTLTIGVSGDLSGVAGTAEIDLKTAGLYTFDCFVKCAAETQVVATYVADGSSAGAADIEVEYGA